MKHTQKPFRTALHTWTIHTTPLDICLDATAKAGFDAIEIRRSDVVDCFDRGMTKDDVIAMMRDSDVSIGVLGTEYGWFFTPPEEQKRLFGVLHETCEIAKAVGCDMIMSAPGQVTGTVKDAIAATRIAGAIVAEYDLKLALEFNSQHPVVNRTAVLREIIEGAGHPSCGMLLDAYHLHRSQGVSAGLDGVRADELFAFQYSDAPLHPTPGIRRPIDRLVPGKGVIDWNNLFGRLSEIGYDGYLSYEAPNPALWERSPYEVCAEAVEITRALLLAAACAENNESEKGTRT
ncbi:sugar phosphate isomerase/epimerase [Hoeflea sp. IMCC20628]|uniref:sugar phosphate isomerase/epimerase family protein n=1 Tax=Hoeflea sp. IMCC20628 TaxID=1620421 RepID=UPI00063AFB41|nr:sugar phosphate isomerase/epimerase [Hoeflea sp. IMCC20628]AKI02724.1 sugar phosphate isomerase/epimerase [Hoeflea sp. IMCC20628]